MTPDEQVRDHLHDAHRNLTTALSHLHRLIPPATTIRRLRSNGPQGDPGCASCRRIGTFSPTGTGTGPHCWWCYKWTLAHDGKLPPTGVVEAHAQGRKITTRVVDEATRAERRPKRKPRAKR